MSDVGPPARTSSPQAEDGLPPRTRSRPWQCRPHVHDAYISSWPTSIGIFRGPDKTVIPRVSRWHQTFTLCGASSLIRTAPLNYSSFSLSIVLSIPPILLIFCVIQIFHRPFHSSFPQSVDLHHASEAVATIKFVGSAKSTRFGSPAPATLTPRC